MMHRALPPTTEPEGWLLPLTSDTFTIRRLIANQLVKPGLTPEHIGYLHGRRYRAELLATARPVLRQPHRTTLKKAILLLPFSCSDPRSRIADALGAEYATDRHSIQADARYAAAVDTIALNCGEQVVALLLGGHPLLSRKTTEQIARTAPTRQRYEMDLVAQGRRPLRAAAPVFDTIDFGEIISRLRRAEGKVRMGLHTLRNALLAAPPSPQDSAVLAYATSRLIEAARELARLIKTAPEEQPTESEQPTTRRPTRDGHEVQKPLGAPGYRGVVGRLSNAGSYILKSVRDLPTLLRQVHPLRREKEEIEDRLRRIVADCRAILRDAAEPGTA